MTIILSCLSLKITKLIPNSFRHSQDSGTVNSRGRNLLEICTALNLRIFNGRIVGDLEGKKTCFHYNGSSVVDYVIGSKAILQNVRYLIVNPLMPHLSDHCHVTYAIKAILAGSPVSSICSNGCTLSEHNRLLWDIKLKNKLKECLESQIVQSKLQETIMLTLRLNYLVKKHVKKPA